LKFLETPLPGAFVIDLELTSDERGFFARSFCRDEFLRHNLNSEVAQCSVSFNHLKGTLRGLHYQAKPHEETKLVRCTAGAMYDVIVDIRPASPTFRRWFATELTAHNHRMLYAPEGLAHGFQTLVDHTEVFYQISMPYHPESAKGIRWDDPSFGIEWPLTQPILSERDRSYPNYVP